METVVEAAGVDRFTLLGLSQGGPIAIAYAARHPQRVSRLVLYGAYARGRAHRPGPHDQDEADAHRADPHRGGVGAIRVSGACSPRCSSRTARTSSSAWFDDLQRVSCSPEHAARSRAVRYNINVTALAATLAVPTLVMHARGDALVPFEEGRHLVSLIPDARFASVDSANHILLEDEPAWAEFRAELRAFLPVSTPPADGDLEDLTGREQQVLALVVAGHGNAAVAAALHLSVRTVERHLSNCYTKLGLTGKAARAAAAARFATHPRQIT